MSETRCQICRRSLSEARPIDTDDYTLTFKPDVCGFCAVTLARAMKGITELLRQSHGERRERVIDRLANRLSAEGFDVGDAFAHRRTA